MLESTAAAEAAGLFGFVSSSSLCKKVVCYGSENSGDEDCKVQPQTVAGPDAVVLPASGRCAKLTSSEKARTDEAAVQSEYDVLTGFTTVFVRQSGSPWRNPGSSSRFSVQAGETTPQGTALIKLDHDQQRLGCGNCGTRCSYKPLTRGQPPTSGDCPRPTARS